MLKGTEDPGTLGRWQADLSRMIPGGSNIITLDHSSLAVVSCMMMYRDHHLYIPRKRDYAMPCSRFADGFCLYGTEDNDAFTVVSTDAGRLAAFEKELEDVVMDTVLLEPPAGTDARHRNRDMPEMGHFDKGALERTLLGSPVVRFGEYRYFIHPLSDGVPYITSELLREGVALLRDMLMPAKVLLTAVTMGIPLTAPLSMLTGAAMRVALKRDPGGTRIRVRQQTGYSSSYIYVPRLPKDAAVSVIDDVLSTAGTLRALADAARRSGTMVVGANFMFNKDRDTGSLQEELGFPVRSVFDVEVDADGRVNIMGS